MSETNSSSSCERPFTRSQSRLRQRISMKTPAESEKASSKKETALAAPSKPKFPLRSVPAPLIRSASTAAKSNQHIEPSLPLLRSRSRSSQPASANTSKKETLAKAINSNRPTLPTTAGAATYQNESVNRPQVQPTQRTRAARNVPRPSPAPRRPQCSKLSAEENTPDKNSTQKTSANAKTAISKSAEMKDIPASCSAAAPKVLKRSVQAKEEVNPSVREILALAKAAKEKKAKNPFAQNIVERAQGKMLPLPIDDPAPLRNRQIIRRLGTSPGKKVSRNSPIQKAPSQRTAVKEKTHEKKSQPATRARKKIQPLPNVISGKSRHPITQKRLIPQSSTDSTRAVASRQPITRSRKRISISSDEHDLESPPTRFEQEKVPLTQSAQTKDSDSDSEPLPNVSISVDQGLSTSSSESDSTSSSDQDSSQSASGSETYDDANDDGPKSYSRPVRRGKTIPEYMRRQMGLPELQDAERRSKGKIPVSRRSRTHEPVAQKSAAGKSLAGKSLSRKPFAGKSLAGKSLAGKTVAHKRVSQNRVADKKVPNEAVASKTVAHKTVACKTVPQMTTIPTRRVHAGGIRPGSIPIPQTSHHSKDEESDSASKTNSDESDADSNEKDGASTSSDSENESFTDDPDDFGKRCDEREAQRTESQRNRSVSTDYEARRKEMRDKCSQQLLKQNKEEYSSSVREEFFLEMEYVLHLLRNLKKEGSVRDQLNGSMNYFEKEIAPLRLDGLKVLGCQIEAENYSCWLQLFHARRRTLKETANPAWMENFLSVQDILNAASESARPGKKVTMQLDDSHLKFLCNNWKILRSALDIVALFSSELCKIQTEGGGCQLQ